MCVRVHELLNFIITVFFSPPKYRPGAATDAVAQEQWNQVKKREYSKELIGFWWGDNLGLPSAWGDIKFQNWWVLEIFWADIFLFIICISEWESRRMVAPGNGDLQWIGDKNSVFGRQLVKNQSATWGCHRGKGKFLANVCVFWGCMLIVYWFSLCGNSVESHCIVEKEKPIVAWSGSYARTVYF